jgi:hypothetical protein
MRRTSSAERQTGFRRRVWERGGELVDWSSFRYTEQANTPWRSSHLRSRQYGAAESPQLRRRGEDGAAWVRQSSGKARPEAEAAFLATQGVDGVSNTDRVHPLGTHRPSDRTSTVWIQRIRESSSTSSRGGPPAQEKQRGIRIPLLRRRRPATERPRRVWGSSAPPLHRQRGSRAGLRAALGTPRRPAGSRRRPRGRC